MRETRPPTVLARMFDGEWASEGGHWAKVATGIVAMALPAGMLLLREGSPIPEYAGKYRLLSKLPTPDAYRATVLADEIALLVALAAVTGLAALLAWQSLLPRRRAEPRPNPPALRRRASGVRRSVAGERVLLARVPVRLLRDHGAALLPPGAFVRVSVYAQGADFGGCVLALLRSWAIQNWGAAEIAALPRIAAWTPPVWFAGLNRVLAGSDDPFLRDMASRAVTGAAAVVAIAAIAYCLAYRRYRRLLIESPESSRGGATGASSICWRATRAGARSCNSWRRRWPAAAPTARSGSRTWASLAPSPSTARSWTARSSSATRSTGTPTRYSSSFFSGRSPAPASYCPACGR